MRIAIDDFGTGYSALSYLRHVPLDVVKLDRSFIQSMAASVQQRELVQGIVGLADVLGLQVIAEGIETEHERDLAARIGCAYGQGFLFSPALPVNDAQRWLARGARPSGELSWPPAAGSPGRSLGTENRRTMTRWAHQARGRKARWRRRRHWWRNGWGDRMARIVILGAGFGGLELASRLSAGLGGDADIALIDQSDSFVFGFAKLDVMFGRQPAAAVRHYYRDLVQPGVRFVPSTVRSIDPAGKRVVTDAGTFDADFLVVALGADLHPDATPGLVECGHEFYTVAGAFALRDVLDRFDGGRVIVAVTSTPFKCPPAPSETALLMHDHLSGKGLRDRSDISLVMPLGSPIPPSPAASEALLRRFAEVGVAWHPQRLVRALDPDRRVALLADGDEMPFDLFLGVPVHRAPAVVEESGLAVDGWIPVDSLTLETRFPGVFAVGDVTSVGTPKAGVFAEGQAAVVADRIVASVRADEALGAVRRKRHVLYRVRDGSRRDAWTSRSSADNRRRASSTSRRRHSPPTRRTSAPAGSAVGSAPRDVRSA